MGISDFSLSRHTLRLLIVWRYGHQPGQWDLPSSFIYLV